MADVTEVTESGSNKFVLKSTSGDLHFEAPPIERNNWVFTLKSKIVEAKAAEEEITASEGYKAVLEKLSKSRYIILQSYHFLIFSSQPPCSCRRPRHRPHL